MNYKTQNGQIISGQDPNLQGFIDGGAVPVVDPAPVVNNNVPAPVVNNNTTTQNTTNKLFADYQTGLSKEDITSREEQARELRRQQADIMFAPRLQRAEDLNAAQISTAKGVVGQRQGFNISTAEQQYIATLEAKAEERIKQIEKEKENYIATGDFNASQRADASLRDLREVQNNLLFKKVEVAMQLGAQEIQKSQFEDRMKLDMANALGHFDDGSSTFAAQQAKIADAYARANITGLYDSGDGKGLIETLAAKTSRLDNELRKKGIKIQWAQLNESIRSNMAREAKDGVVNAAGAIKYTGDLQTNIKLIANKMINLKDSGMMNDETWDLYMDELITEMYGTNVQGADLDKIKNSWGSLVAQEMERIDGTIALDNPTIEPASDFESSYSSGEAKAGESTRKWLMGVMPTISNLTTEGVARVVNFVGGFLDLGQIPEEDIKKLKMSKEEFYNIRRVFGTRLIK